MLDPKLIRNEPDRVRDAVVKRGESTDIVDQFLKIDTIRRERLVEVEKLKNTRNTVSQEVALRKKEKQDAEELILQMRDVSSQIKSIDEEVREIEEKTQQLLLTIPNIPHESVPHGASEDDNVEMRLWGTIPNFSFQPKPH